MFPIEYNLFNGLEAFFWIAIGIILFFRLRFISTEYKKNTLWGGIVFILFGISDIAEIMIGGIFEPRQLWLFALKAGGVTTLIVFFIRYVLIRKRDGV